MIRNLEIEKKNLRLMLKSRRAGLVPELRQEYSQRITEKILSLPEIINARTIFTYISCGTELDTHPLINALLDSGKQLAVPKILDRETMVAVQFEDWGQLKPAELGILAPTITEPMEARFDVVITPGLGFTESGDRIGFGAGYYDRWFDRNPDVCKIAPAFEVQLVKDIPVDEYDQPVDQIITETRNILVTKSR